MDCSKYEKYLSSYLDNELDADPSFEIEKHLEKCQVCRIKFESLVAVKESIKALPDFDLPLDFQDSLYQGIKKNEFKNRLLQFRYLVSTWQVIAILIFILSAFFGLKFAGDFYKQKQIAAAQAVDQDIHLNIILDKHMNSVYSLPVSIDRKNSAIMQGQNMRTIHIRTASYEK